jgi:hypothetical protein
MSKQEKPKTEKSDTAAAVSTAKENLARSENNVTAISNEFDADPNPEFWQRVIATKAQHSFHVRVHDLACAAHAAAVQAEQDRTAAEAEAKRIAELKLVHDDIASNETDAIAAAAVLAKCLARSWDCAIREQGLGGLGRNDFAWNVNAALRSALIDCGQGHAAITVN